MPWAAAAFVTSGSFAAPSSIEYSVCTCRCAKESEDEGLLTGVRCSSVVVRARPAGGPSGDRRGRPACVRLVLVADGARQVQCLILALVEVYSAGLTGRVSPSPDRSVTSVPSAAS